MIITLTDFGNSEYLGVMKGVILTISPKSNIIDLYNEVSSHCVKEAAWVLLSNYPFFPQKSIFLCVVDPGVGTERRALIIESRHYVFVGPDNGLMYPAAQQDRIKQVYKIHVPQSASSTFHGRDVFCKIAAKLDAGTPSKKLGNRVSKFEKLTFYNKDREGEIVRIDRFGNIITNLPPMKKTLYHTSITSMPIDFYKTYADAPAHETFLVKGSANTLEIAMKNKPAASKYKVKVGDRITIN